MVPYAYFVAEDGSCGGCPKSRQRRSRKRRMPCHLGETASSTTTLCPLCAQEQRGWLLSWQRSSSLANACNPHILLQGVDRRVSLLTAKIHVGCFSAVVIRALHLINSQHIESHSKARVSHHHSSNHISLHTPTLSPQGHNTVGHVF